MTSAKFYLSTDQEEKKNKRSLARFKGKALSLSDILQQRIEAIASNVFTNSKEISETSQMDKIQKLIQDNQ